MQLIHAIALTILSLVVITTIEYILNKLFPDAIFVPQQKIRYAFCVAVVVSSFLFVIFSKLLS